jgi:hypothetical protein
MAYRQHQAAYGKTYGGEYDTHASHYISDKELGHFGVSHSAGNYYGNYRNCNAHTNLSQHKRMDNMLMNAHTGRADSLSGFSYNSGGHSWQVSHQDMVDRVSHKIEVAKASGSIDNDRLCNYLYKSADRLNMDMRAFNGHR